VTHTDGALSAAEPSARDGWGAKVFVIFWGLALLAGMGFLWRYKSIPGPAAVAPLAWPQVSRLPVVADKPTLVLFVHPECPCTRASLSELRELLSVYAGRVTVCVATLHLEDPPPGWDEEEVQDSVASLSGTTRFDDTQGREARLFGATTSGHAFLFGRDGRLLFSGGITAARGHAGHNPCEQILEDALAAELGGRRSDEVAHAPVFGCALFEAETPAVEAR